MKMILKPFLRPVFVKLIKPDESFVSDIINKILSTDNGDYGNLSLVYLKNASEDKSEESETLKADFDINFIYKLLMQLYAVKNNKNIINSSKSYHVQNIQNNLNHYLKALSYIDNNLCLKLRAINKEINEIHADQIINMNEIISTLKKSSMINNNQMLNINRTVIFNGNYYNNEKNIAASNNVVNNNILNLSEKTIPSIKNNILSNNRLNRRSMSNFTENSLFDNTKASRINSELSFRIINKILKEEQKSKNNFLFNIKISSSDNRTEILNGNNLLSTYFIFETSKSNSSNLNKLAYLNLDEKVTEIDNNNNLFNKAFENYTDNLNRYYFEVSNNIQFLSSASIKNQSLSKKIHKEINDYIEVNYKNNLNTSSEINKVLEAAALTKDISLVWEAFDNKNYKTNYYNINKASKINSNLSFRIVNKILKEEKRSKKKFRFKKQTYSNNNSFEILNRNNFILETSEIYSLYLNKLANLNIVRKGTEVSSSNILFNKEVENYTDTLNGYAFDFSNNIQFLSYASIKNHRLSKKVYKEINDYREVNYKGGKVNKFESFLFNDLIKKYSLSKELFKEINDYGKADYKGLNVNRFQDLYFNTSRTNKILQHELIRKNISSIMENLWSNIYKFNYSTTINNEKNLTERKAVDKNNAVNNYIFDLNRNVIILKSKFANNVSLGVEALKCINKYNEALNFYSKNSLFFSNSNSDSSSSKSLYDFSGNNVWNTNRASKINSNLLFNIVNKILNEEKESKKKFLFNKQTYSNNNRSKILSGNKSLNTYFMFESSNFNSIYLNKLAYLNIVKKGNEINNDNNLFNKEVENYTDTLNGYAFNLSNNIQFLSYTFTKNQSLSKKAFKEITKYRQASYNGGKVNKFESFSFNDFIKNHSLSKELFKEINDYRNRFLFLNSVQKEVNNYNIKKYLYNSNSNKSKSLYDFTGNTLLNANKTLKNNSNLVSNIVNKILNEKQISNKNFHFYKQTTLKTNKAEILNQNYASNIYSLLKSGENYKYNNILNDYSLYFCNNIKKILSNNNFNSQGQEYKWYYSQLLEDGKQHNYISRNQIANNTNIIQDIILKSLILNKPIFKAVNNENTNNMINGKSSFNDINKISNISKAFLAYMKFSVIDKNTFDSDYFSVKNTKLSINKNLFNNLGAFHKLYNSEIFHNMTNNNHIKVNKLGSNANLYDTVVLKNQISSKVHFNNKKRLLNKIGILNQNLYENKRNDFQAEFNNDYVGFNRKKSYESNSEIFEETYKNKVNINHKRLQQTNISKEEKITDIKREQDREHIIEEKMKRFINETVEILIEDKFKKHDLEKIDEDKQIESISNKVIEKIDRQLKYEKRRRGLI